MAWDALPDGGGFDGDAPRDVLTSALARVADLYRARFGRAPLLHELLHALRVVLTTGADAFLHDPQRLTQIDFAAARPTRVPLAPDAFVGAWSENPQPDGTWHVSRRSDDEDVVRCLLRVEGRVLRCDYEIVDVALDDDDARLLIAVTLLRDHARGTYAEQADQVAFAPRGRPDDACVVAYAEL